MLEKQVIKNVILTLLMSVIFIFSGERVDAIGCEYTGYFFEIADSSCEEILGDALDLVQQAFDVIKIAAPILLIFFGTLDFSKAAISGDDKAIKKATTDFMKITAAAVIIFLLPFLIELLFSLPGLDELDIENVLCDVGKVVLRK